MGKKKDSTVLHGTAITNPWVTSVEDLVFYAIDKASPYNLGLDARSSSMEKIGALTFPQLQIDKYGLMILWTIINGGLSHFGGQGVPVAVASKCKTANDVLLAAQKSTEGS